MSKRCWIIAGASSAIAIRFAQLVAQEGDQLILLGRDLEKLKSIQNDLIIRYEISVDVIFFDAEKTTDHLEIASACMKLAKFPIHLLLAFGVMLNAPAISHSHHEVMKTIQVNYAGVVSTIYAFLPFFRAQKQGSIIVLGSVAGDRGRPSNFDYGSAKSALPVFCEGLNASLAADQVTVTLMKLGYIDTPMTYGKAGSFIAASPDACAQACLQASQRKKLFYYFPWFWRWIMLIFKCMPTFMLKRVKV